MLYEIHAPTLTARRFSQLDALREAGRLSHRFPTVPVTVVCLHLGVDSHICAIILAGELVPVPTESH